MGVMNTPGSHFDCEIRMPITAADGLSWAWKASVSVLALQAGTVQGRTRHLQELTPALAPAPSPILASAPSPAWAPAPPLPVPGACPIANSTMAMADNYVARMGQALEQAATQRGSLNATEIAAAFSQLGASLGSLWCGGPALSPIPNPPGAVRYVPEFIPLSGFYFGNPAVTSVSACYIASDSSVIAYPGQASPVDEETPDEEATEEPANVGQTSPTTPTEESPTTPTEESPTTPTEESPTTPTEESPTTPTEESPTTPTEESPTTPTEESPTTPTEESPTTPTEETSTPTEETSTPTEETSTPTEETGEDR